MSGRSTFTYILVGLILAKKLVWSVHPSEVPALHPACLPACCLLPPSPTTLHAALPVPLSAPASRLVSLSPPLSTCLLPILPTTYH